jgi:hypothetical protein
MNPFDPFNFVNLSGTGTMRGVTLALPTDRVREMLPKGLDLGPQNITPPGTHPIMLGFHDMFRLHLSIPSLLPNMTYREHSVGIPFAYVTNDGPLTPASPGPYFFMPILLLDNIWATMGGVMFWGLPKRLATFSADATHYRVLAGDGTPLTSASWEESGEYRPVSEYTYFEPVRQALMQPLIGMVPLSMGPFFVVADFPKRWDVATLRPLHTITDVYTDYVLNYPSGRYPARGRSPGIDESVMGSFELRTPWMMSAPYPPMRA